MRFSGAMVNNHESWYLAAVAGRVVNTFSPARIKFVSVPKEHFVYDIPVVERTKMQYTICFGQFIFNITHEASRDLDFYFECKALFPKQKVVERRQDGSLVISTSVWSYDQIAPILQYWTPNIQVISPRELDTYVKQNLTSWLNKTSNTAGGLV